MIEAERKIVKDCIEVAERLISKLKYIQEKYRDIDDHFFVEKKKDGKIYLWHKVIVYESELQNRYNNDIKNLINVLDDLIYQEIE